MKKEWEVKKLVDVCEFFNDGNWIESKDQSESGLRLIQTGNVGIGEFRNKSGKERYISEETFKRLKCTEIFEGDILISRLPDPVGRTCIIPNLNQRLITAVDCTVVRLKKDILHPDYFKYYSQSSIYFKNIAEKITGTTRDRISRSNLGIIPIPIPSLQEQQQIVSTLDKCFLEINQAKANIEKNLNNAKEIFQSELNSIFTNKGEGWEEKTLGEMIEIRNGKNQQGVLSESGKYKIMGSAGNIMGYATDFICEAGTTIIGRKGNISKPIYINEKFWNVDTAFGFYPKNENVIDKRFVYYICLGIDFKSMNRGTTIPSLVKSELQTININFPKSLKVQQVIVHKLDKLSSECKELETLYQQKLKELEDLKKSILQKAFNGELKTI